MATATTTSHDTGQHTTSRSTTQPTITPTTQLERSAAQRLRTTMAAVKLAFTWLGVRKTLAPEQRTTAARAFHADRELLTASKLILDTNWTGAEIKSCCRLASLLDVPLVQAAQNVVPVAVTAGDKIEGLRQWASGRCLSADRAGVYSRSEVGGGRRRRVVREPGVN
jgi:hypothetical protein